MTTTRAPAVEAVDLVKRFGDNTAVDGVSFSVPTGSVLGMLGPNGAGKTTTVRMLTTMSRPTSGTGRVAGHDIIEEPDAVRRSMGLTGQVATVDELLTGRENIRLIGRFAGLNGEAVRRIGDELLERFSLTDAADRVARTYSGGMRRRLDLAVSLVATPPVLFLDEPTTGLDPTARLGLWDVVGELTAAGTTVLLTTQYLEEADRLADRIVVLHRGRVAAQGTPAQLKAMVGGKVVHATVPADRRVELAVPSATTAPVDRGRVRVSVPASDAASAAEIVARIVSASGGALSDLEVSSPSLDDVYFHLMTQEIAA